MKQLHADATDPIKAAPQSQSGWHLRVSLLGRRVMRGLSHDGNLIPVLYLHSKCTNYLRSSVVIHF